MLFNSAEFILAFLPLGWLVYFWLNRRRLTLAGKVWLVLASLFFYGWWNPAYLGLILVSIAVNFALGSALARAPGQRPLLFLGVAFDLGLLAYFKYADFFVANLNAVFGAGWPLPGVVLPLAVSFFTFTQIAYLVDSYRGAAREYDLLNYALFVTFFPHLIAGPILHHKEMMPQFASRRGRVMNYPNIARGLFLFSVGLFKKVIIADGFAVWAGAGFDQATTLNFFEAWATSLSYTFQLYFDFSGYTDMALGAALLFNIRLPVNFNSPYKAVSIRDFWRRWHITLSRFLRDYLYIPLGGNRRGRGRAYLNLGLTFLLGGLWHGASWMFVIWGALHGAAMVLHRLWHELGGRLPAWLAWLVTFNFVNLAWVFFRAADMAAAEKVLKGMAGLNGLVLPAALADRLGALAPAGLRFGPWVGGIGADYRLLLWLAAALVLTLGFRNSNEMLFDAAPGRILRLRWAAACALMAAVSLVTLMASAYSEFIYFNF